MKTLDVDVVMEWLGRSYFHELSTFGALSEAAVLFLLCGGRLLQLHRGDLLYRAGEPADAFYVILQGDLRFYKQAEGQDVLTRHFGRGELLGFDAMIGLHPRSGTAVAGEDTLVLEVGSALFFDLHTQFAADFGLMMINLSRELSREIALLENVIGQSLGWHSPQNNPEV
ncbi:Crp/Fnr family transcriptional regulator [Marinobacterium rhizophilum]|uniref:Crp/Fnr family transcriptional regulator n=1 Tax=Marinobacterium rhizophilum TaxID=420402 RepID=A0ABY5HS83_9GAMM|nr:Crp/Fnr family transcriptional regulator [Marinobacterium rhizophilum]UTW14059.1 Crp/Fnr family transcriptional regulator [Marinobacterium rhizophilum]